MTWKPWKPVDPMKKDGRRRLLPEKFESRVAVLCRPARHCDESGQARLVRMLSPHLRKFAIVC